MMPYGRCESQYGDLCRTNEFYSFSVRPCCKGAEYSALVVVKNGDAKIHSQWGLLGTEFNSHSWGEL